PGMSSRIAHHIDFPDYTSEELFAIAQLLLGQMQYTLSDEAEEALREYIELRKAQPHLAPARPIRNAVERARPRPATRPARSQASLTKDELMKIEAVDLRASRVFGAKEMQP